MVLTGDLNLEHDTSRSYSAETEESLLVLSGLLDVIAIIVHPSNHLTPQNFLHLEGENQLLVSSFLKKWVT